MSMLKVPKKNVEYDYAIFGLGYEKRSTYIYGKKFLKASKCLVLGYTYHTHIFEYQSNKMKFKNSKIREVDDGDIEKEILSFIEKYNITGNTVNILIDITVMSRHRLAVVLWTCLKCLPKGSTVRVVYSLSDFVSPPEEISPVKEIGPLINQLEGVPGNVGFATSLVVSLGYEENKALGASNYIDANKVIAFIPKSEVFEFNDEVIRSNNNFLRSVNEKNRFFYDLHSPYKTYVELKSVALSLMKESRPIILPLGPKLMAALSVILGIELYPYLPVWRLSSKGAEKPVDRKPSGHVVSFDYQI